MAAPNMIGATTILGKTTAVSIVNTSSFAVLSNASGSGKCLKINTLNVANYSNATVTVSVSYNDAAALGGNSFFIVGNLNVPSGSTLNVIDKTSQYYLEENRSIGVVSSVGNSVVVSCSYEDIS